MEGFIKLSRSEEVLELLHHDHNAFILMTFIAYRAKRSDSFSAKGLQRGEAVIGDYKHMGLTEQQYRTAKKHLINYGFITCKATNKGTIARVLNTKVYNINEDTGNVQNNGQTTDKQRTSNGQTTTNKNERKKECNNERSKYTYISEISDSLLSDFLKVRTAKKAPLTETAWRGILREAEKAGITPEEAVKVCIERNWQSYKHEWTKDKNDKPKFRGETF